MEAKRTGEVEPRFPGGSSSGGSAFNAGREAGAVPFPDFFASVFSQAYARSMLPRESHRDGESDR